jgi:hypothetical protein
MFRMKVGGEPRHLVNTIDKGIFYLDDGSLPVMVFGFKLLQAPAELLIPGYHFPFSLETLVFFVDAVGIDKEFCHVFAGDGIPVPVHEE